DYGRLLLWIGAAEHLPDHVPERRGVVGAKSVTKPATHDFRRRSARNFIEMPIRIVLVRRGAIILVLLQDVHQSHVFSFGGASNRRLAANEVVDDQKQDCPDQRAEKSRRLARAVPP